MNARRSRGYARIPRELPTLLADLPPSAHALAYHSIVSGADRPDGRRTSHAADAAELNLDVRVVQRWKPVLRERGIIDYPSKTSRSHVVRLGHAVLELLGESVPASVARSLAVSVVEEHAAEDVSVVQPARANGLTPIGAVDASLVGGASTKTDTERTSRKRTRWIENLDDYTGCRHVRGEIGIGHKHDPLGTDPPPKDWPYGRPAYAEIRAALDASGDEQ